MDSDSDGNYDDDLHCVWTIVAPEDHMILLNIMRMDIEEEVNCLMDYLKVCHLSILFPVYAILLIHKFQSLRKTRPCLLLYVRPSEQIFPSNS